MLIQQNTTPTLTVLCDTPVNGQAVGAAAPAGYQVVSDGNGTPAAGGGTFYGPSQATANSAYRAFITLGASDTSALGDLYLEVLDGSGNVIGRRYLQIVAFDPTNVVTLGLLALPDAIAGQSTGLHILGANAGNVSYSGTFTYAGTLAMSGGLQVTPGIWVHGNGTGSGNNVATVYCQGTSNNVAGLEADGNGLGAGVKLLGGATGPGLQLVGGGTSGAAVSATNTTGDVWLVSAAAGNGNAVKLTGNGSGVGLSGSMGGNITGNLSGSVGSISGVSFPSNFGTLVISSGGRVAIQSGITRNAALANFPFTMYATDHVSPKTGLSVTAQRSLDGGAFGNCANAVTEVGNGAYVINLASTDLNAGTVILYFTASGADPVFLTLVTTP